jgi:dipeptidyl aminopeptidase/acylaminoacyl peptidase
VFGYSHDIYQVPSRGGVPTILIEQPDDDPRGNLWFPHLPSIRSLAPVLFFSACTGYFEDCHVVVQHLETGERQVVAAGVMPAFSPTGHVLYSSWPEGALFARPFSVTTLQPPGDAFRVAESGWAPSVASDGTLAYLGRSGSSRPTQLVRRGRDGEELGLVGQPHVMIGTPRLSPDGSRVATRGSHDIWIHDVNRPIKSRLTFGGDLGPFSWPTWSPAGDRLAFTEWGSGDIYVMAVDAAAELEVLVATPHRDYLEDWSPDGRHVLFSRLGSGEQDLWYVDAGGDPGPSEPIPFIERPEVQHLARFSPDGRYVAYLSRESGRSEVYVEQFPEGGDRVQVSSEGASQLRWGRNGEIFYVRLVGEGDVAIPPADRGTLVGVPVTTTPTLSAGTPRDLFESPGLVGPHYSAMYDVSADGQTFFIAEPVGKPPPQVIRVVQNWFADFAGHDKGPEE